jgi:hypothetical protein
MKHLVTIILNFRHLIRHTRREVRKLTHERLLGKYMNNYVSKTNVIERKASLEALENYKKQIHGQFNNL